MFWYAIIDENNNNNKLIAITEAEDPSSSLRKISHESPYSFPKLRAITLCEHVYWVEERYF